MRFRRALLVGLNDYDDAPTLYRCVADAEAMAVELRRNDDKSPNFKCEVLTSDGLKVTRAHLMRAWRELFENADGDVLFYFSGHGVATSLGGYLFTQDGSQHEPGLPMNDLVKLANNSTARTVLIILDCCYAGAAGSDADVVGTLENEAKLREGVTILAASRPRQKALELGEHGLFTRLVLAALKGGAADVRGHVSAASIYAYAEAVLGAMDQRPLYKSHAASLEPVRLCEAAVSDQVLRELPDLFAKPDAPFSMDPSYERTHPSCVPAHVAVFQKFKQLQVAGLLRPEVGRDLYDTALGSQSVKLTLLGHFYWELAKAAQV